MAHAGRASPGELFLPPPPPWTKGLAAELISVCITILLHIPLSSAGTER